MAKEKPKPKNLLDDLQTKKIKEYEAVLKLIDELTEYLKPIVGEDNKEVNKRLHKIRFKISMMPLTDMIEHTIHASMNIFMAGKKFKDYEKEFNEDYLKNTGDKDFEKFVRGDKE